MRSLVGRARASAALLLLLGVAVLACEGGDGEAGTTSTGGGTGAEEEFPLPRILDPASETVSIPINQVTPLLFGVNGVVPGITEVHLTNRPLGTLSPANELGSLSADALTLNLSGAMLPGAHQLSLVNPGNEGSQRSRTVTLALIPAGTPAWSLGAPAPFADGESLTVDGAFDRALLTVVDDTPAAAAAGPPVSPRAGHGWDPSPRRVPMPGYTRADDEGAPPVSAAWSTRAADGDADDRLRITWRIGQEGQSVGAVDVPWSGDDPGVLETIAAAPAPIDAPIEWAAYVRPRFLGRDVVIEMLALSDTEGARPGDRRLVHVPWPAGEAPAAPRLVATPELADLDALGPGFDLADPQRPRLALRYAGLSPAFVELDSGGAAQLLRRDEPLGTPADAPVEVVGVASSLGAWSAFSIDGDGTHALNQLDTLNTTISPPYVVEAAPLPAPSAAPAVSVLDGVPCIAVPYGDDEVVHVAALGGGLLRLRPLEGLHCDAVALAVGDLAAPSTALICLSDAVATVRPLSVVFE
jgi:hypothetical protein